jgi:hypothetical protein
MYLATQEFTNTPEFLKSERYQNVSCTVSDANITANETGHKFVPGGTLLDATGSPITITQAENEGSYTYTLSADPVGILFRTIEVTHGPQPGALMIDGSVNAERLQTQYAAEAVQLLIPKMPFIKFFVNDALVLEVPASTQTQTQTP